MMRSTSKLVKSSSKAKVARSSSMSKMARSSSKMMARSSSKLVTQVRSIRNLGRTSMKFQVELCVNKVEKIAGKGSCVLVMEKPGATGGTSSQVSTSAVAIDSCTADFSGVSGLTVEVTLFKNKPSDQTFQAKGLKVSLRSGRVDGTALGKMGFNVAEYASGPDIAVPFCATMNGGPVLKGRLACTAVGEGDEEEDGTGGGGGSCGLEEFGDDGGRASDAVNSLTEEGAPPKSVKNKFTKVRVSTHISRTPKKRSDGETSLANDGELERVLRHNSELRKKLENGGDESRAAEENATLKAKIDELQAARKEPLPPDVVKQLKEAKMALAMMSLEKEEMLMNLRRCRGAGTPH